MKRITVKELAELQGIKPDSLQKKLRRRKLGDFGVNDVLPEDVITILNAYEDSPIPHEADGEDQDEQPEVITPEPEVTPPVRPPVARQEPPARETKPKAEPKAAETKMTWRDVFAMLPLPMLGAAAAYGVYFFAKQFVPAWVAVAEAAAFELVYIGLSVMEGLSEKKRAMARKVSLGAVAVSVIYNSLAAAIHLQPDLMKSMHVAFIWILSVVHGAPLAILSFFVADLLTHKK